MSPASQAALSGAVREAVRGDQVYPHYQPIVELVSRDVVAVEALARWAHPCDGLIAPERFIPAAESGGFIGDLFFQMLRRVCVDGLKWRSPVQIAVNVSPHQFHDAGLADKILSVLDRTGFPPHRLEIEVTEGNPMLDWSRAAKIFQTLKAHGIRLALDDFGTGYANLGHLHMLPFDRVKIDRSFLQAILERAENRTIVRSIIALSRELGLSTIGEGVETVGQMDWLKEAGCELAQGHYFGFPLSAEAIEDLL
ncbi:putative bifunctional diguanylate cyclase/phosphodiesterase [Amorphus sp. 3PC139-8]|uniref:putative bifunctional diguanylate cyclase/phosphodiesterase n=1 Tax=Amorphus sp. 3PC139-8 TaxID=2735676 RepID=UPI00345D48FE